MFFFTNYSFISILTAIGICIGLVLISELTRRSKYIAIIVFIALPIYLTLFVWGKNNSASASTWFAWVKTYSALAGVIGFMAIRNEETTLF